jgi:N-methylhydantoinase A
LAYRVAVDIGGTFTDLVLEDTFGCQVGGAKVLSTPGHLVDGVIGAVRASGIPASEVSLFVHGTTAGLNAVLERRGGDVALVTTRGFGDTYLIGRGHRPQMYDLHYRKPITLVDRAAIYEVDERLAADGSELAPVDEANVVAVAESIRERGHSAVAVCLLHAYANGDHELEVGRILSEHLDVPVVLSHGVAPEWREYERTSTTVMSAYITPIMGTYLEQVKGALQAEGLQVPVYITESNGGVMSSAVAREKAVLTLFSGPVGGVVGARAAGAALDISNLITIDMGGTSFDVSLVREGEAGLMSEFELMGLPVLTPAVEVHTIGAGGGSLIRESGGALSVGPESAGAVPGPACYGNGGTEPTVTDANVVLGRIPADQRLAGKLPLDAEAARSALAEVGDRLGLSPEELAEQALEIAHFSMAEAIRELTIERGLDPRDFVLCAFGGAGGLHATALAEELEIGRVLVPMLPGAFSAWGMLQGDIRHDAVRTFYRSLDDAAEHLPDVVSELERQVAQLMETDGVGGGAMRFEVAAELRYVGQEYTLTLAIPAAHVRSFREHAGETASRFHQAYLARYGHASSTEPVEFVAIRVAGISELERPQNESRDPAGAGAAGATETRARGETEMRVRGVTVAVALVQREDVIGRVDGPAIVLEETATTVVDDGWTVRPVAGGHLLLEAVR